MKFSMPLNKIISLFCLLFIYSLAYAHSEHKIRPVFDNREWVLGWSQNQVASKNDGSIFDEYILKGDNIDNWSELVTIQFFPRFNSNLTIEAYQSIFSASIKNVCPNAVFSSITQQKQHEKMLNFSIKNCRGQHDQSELLRIVDKDNGIYVFHYAIKVAQMPESNKKTWIKNLQAIEIH
ncbi:MAG: hypothetical protein ACK5WS_04745 [Alphaproteobacteria bacterium]|jgi:hypothetical protein|nr:hypothetical protein [Candidatus Jidaibacter sp.]